MPFKDPIKRKEYHKEYIKKWEILNKGKRKIIQERHDKKRKGLPKRVKQLAEVRFRRHHRNKVAVLEMYGKVCAYCGEDKYEVLTIDHVNDDGANHRRSKEYKKLNVGGMYGFLIKTPYQPKLYQVLCCNCNHAKQCYKIKLNQNGYKSFGEWKKISQRRY